MEGDATPLKQFVLLLLLRHAAFSIIICSIAFGVNLVEMIPSAQARIELKEKTVIAMDFSPMSGSFMYPGDNVAAYKKNIADMRAMGVGALVDDMFNASRDTNNMAAISTAIKQWNAEKNDNFCWFILGDAMDENPATLVNYMKQYGNGSEYCQRKGKPMLAVWNGGRAGATGSNYVNKLLNPLKNASLEPYFIYERGGGPGEPSKVKNEISVMRNAGFDVGFYDFGAGASGGSISKVSALSNALNSIGVDVFPGFSSAYWQVCGKPTSNYMEHDAYRGWQNYWNSVIPGGKNANSKFVWLTMWSDMGEDNYLTPSDQSCKGPYTGNYCVSGFQGNSQMPVWSHRGFYQFAKRYAKWYSTGQEPAITHDSIYFAYRQHPKDLGIPSGDQCAAKGTNINGTGNAKDVVYVTTELTSPATLTVTLGGAQIGSFNAPIGTTHFDVPWSANRGKPTFALVRGGATILSGQGKLEITNSPKAFNGNGTRNFGTYADFISTDKSTGKAYDGGGSASCTPLFPSGSQAPGGYGAAWNVFSTAREPVLIGACSGNNIQITIGSHQPNQYIFNHGFYWDGGQWRQINLSGANPAIGSWLAQEAKGSFPKGDQSPAIFVGYMCQLVENTWKCGCADNACTTPHWQVQAIR